MGTNYYVKADACPHCGRGETDLHIGKSSCGWTFALNTHPDFGIRSLADWRSFWRGKSIIDEYGRSVSQAKMLDIIRRRSRPVPADFDSALLVRNHALPGPNGLLRSRVDGRHCIAHGRGAWDIMRGEFS